MKDKLTEKRKKWENGEKEKGKGKIGRQLSVDRKRSKEINKTKREESWEGRAGGRLRVAFRLHECGE